MVAVVTNMSYAGVQSGIHKIIVYMSNFYEANKTRSKNETKPSELGFLCKKQAKPRRKFRESGQLEY